MLYGGQACRRVPRWTTISVRQAATGLALAFTLVRKSGTCAETSRNDALGELPSTFISKNTTFRDTRLDSQLNELVIVRPCDEEGHFQTAPLPEVSLLKLATIKICNALCYIRRLPFSTTLIFAECNFLLEDLCTGCYQHSPHRASG